jgi:hypothetical protein
MIQKYSYKSVNLLIIHSLEKNIRNNTMNKYLFHEIEYVPLFSVKSRKERLNHIIDS